ncbi:MAG: hypothetical protein DRP64_02525, partial [Verrucomicrobia bacterium]
MGFGTGTYSLISVEGGELNVDDLWLGYSGTGQINLDAGSIHANTITFAQLNAGGGTGSIDIEGGRLFLSGNQSAQIATFIGNGWISAYGGGGRLYYYYDDTPPYRTTVAAVSSMDKAWMPVPRNGQSGVEWSAALGWSAGNGAVEHDVYLGTDSDTVDNADRFDTSGIYRGRQSGTNHVATLEEGVRYYWRIDEVDSGEGIAKGEVWSFTTKKAGRDLYADTWVATDGADRTLSGHDICGSQRTNRTVGMFYFTWHGAHGSGGPRNMTDFIAANPFSYPLDPWADNPDFGPAGSRWWWGEPEAGYFLADDEWMIRRNISMLTDAGVDVLVLDASNSYTYYDEYMKLCEVLHEMKTAGSMTPLQIVFLTRTLSPQTVMQLYNEFYSKSYYSDLWFQWDGKPLMLGYPDGLPSDNPLTSVSQEIRDFFSWRESWAWDDGYNKWQWIDTSPQDYGWNDSSDRPEETTVSCASHANNNIGKSHQNGIQPDYDEHHLPVGGTEGDGLYFAEQWQRGWQLDPEMLFITGWNEWEMGAYYNTLDVNYYLLGERVPQDGFFFVDSYNAEYNRDIEPMKGGYTDNYYYQMVDGIRRYKGVRPLPESSLPQTITIDGIFSEWIDVAPEYRDGIGDTFHRSHDGGGSAGPYVNTTGRNDLLDMKVARDTAYIFFYAKTREPLTSHTDPNWMLLFINADQDHSTGWEGYDYVLNRSPGTGLTTLEQTASGWNWSAVSSEIEYAVSGNEIEIRVPRSLIGQSGGFDPVGLDFHWADNIQADDDIIEFAISGDSAPNRRFDYRYQTREPVESTLLANGFETGDSLGGDLDITTDEAYSGTHSLEYSYDDSVGLSVNNISTVGLDSFRISFKYKLQNIEDSDNVQVWYFDGATWFLVEEIGISQNDVWLEFTDVRHNSGADAWLFDSPILFHISGHGINASYEYAWMDDLEIIGYSGAEQPAPTSEESYAEWAARFGLDPTGSGAKSFDAEYGGIGDGLNNLAEYTLGGD